MMSEAEMALNMKDLDSYMKGEYTLNSMVPGIRAPKQNSDQK
jgi:hypothetical protein